MFDFLKEKDEENDELKRNIEEIRTKVQERMKEGEERGERGPQQVQESPEEMRKRRRLRRGKDFREEDASGEVREEIPEPGEIEVREEEEEGPEIKREEAVSPVQEEPEPERDEGAREAPAEEPSGIESVPEPPELEDIDVPDVEKGPLFISLNKFEGAMETLGSLKEFSVDIEDEVESLRETLAEDRESFDRIEEVLERAEEDTRILRKIVSP